MSEAIISVGSLVNRYLLEADMGGSDIARVFRASDTRLGREVALKLVTHSQNYSSAFVDNFLKEARALAQLTHPNIARVLDFGQDQGYLFLVSEFIHGESLETRLAEGQPSDWREVAEMLIPITEALESAHQAGVIHRDLKPSNILITPDGRPIMTDFSIARILEAEETREMTGTHVGLGSPFYMSPEQGKGLNIDDRSDIYALGTIFFEWITGHKPFAAGSGMEIIIQQVSTPPPSPRQFIPDLPAGIEEIILTMMCKDRDERFQSMMEVKEALEKVLSSGEFSGLERKRKPPIRIWLPVILGFIILGGLAVGGMRIARVGPFAPAQSTPITIASRPSNTPKPKENAVAIPIRQATQTPEATPTSQSTSVPEAPDSTRLSYDYPDLPVLEKTRLPSQNQKHEPENAVNMVELARWGNPSIRAIDWSQDDLHIYAATAAGLYIYEAKELSPVRFIDTKGALTALAVSEDNHLLATGDELGMVRLWNPLTAELIADLPGHTGPISALDFSTTGEKLLSTSTDRTARIWNTNGELIAALSRHGLPVTGGVFLKNDQELVTVSEDFKIVRWNSATGEKTGEWASAHRLLDAVAGENPNQVVVASSNPAVEFWALNEEKGQITSSIKEESSGTLIQALALSPNSTLVATASGDGQVRVWNSGGLLLWSLRAETPVSNQKVSPLIDVKFSHDATRLAGLSQDSALIVWEISTRGEVAQRIGDVEEVSAMAVDWDNRTLVTQFADGTTQLRKLINGTPGRRFFGTLPTGSAAGRVSQNNEWVAVAQTREERGDKVLAVESLYLVGSHMLLGYDGGAVRFLDDRKIIAEGSNRLVNLWSLNSLYHLEAARYRYESNCQVAYNIDDRLLAAGSSLGVFVDETTLPSFCKLRRVPYSQDWAYLDNGDWMVFGLSTGQVELWTADPSGEPISHRIAVEGGAVQAVALSPDERLFATGSADGKIRVWDLQSQTILTVIGNHTGKVTDLVFSMDGTLLITGSTDGTFEIWGIGK